MATKIRWRSSYCCCCQLPPLCQAGLFATLGCSLLLSLAVFCAQGRGNTFCATFVIKPRLSTGQAPESQKPCRRVIIANRKVFRVFTKLHQLNWGVNKSGQFLDSLKTLLTVWKQFRTFGTYIWRKRFTHFWRIYVAKIIYALRPESFCAWDSAHRKVLNFLCLCQAL